MLVLVNKSLDQDLTTFSPSSASTYSCSTSVAGDDQSISSSSSSQSDTSYGSRLPFWVEPLSRQHLPSETASSSSTLKALTSSDDRLYAAVMGSSGTRPSSAQLHPRGLHDSGRQSSLDSGIGIATGSQSSYSGSCSSYTGSLDTASQGGVEEFGSVASLPAFPSSPPSAPPPTPPPPPPSPFQCTPTPDHSSTSASSCPCASRSSSSASRRHSGEYQIPSLLRLRYDTPRSVLQTLSLREPTTQQGQPEPGRGSKSSSDGGGSQGQTLSISPIRLAQRQAMMQRSLSWGSERAPSVDSEGRSTPRTPLVPGETQVLAVSHSFNPSMNQPTTSTDFRVGGRDNPPSIFRTHEWNHQPLAWESNLIILSCILSCHLHFVFLDINKDHILP